MVEPPHQAPTSSQNLASDSGARSVIGAFGHGVSATAARTEGRAAKTGREPWTDFFDFCLLRTEQDLFLTCLGCNFKLQFFAQNASSEA